MKANKMFIVIGAIIFLMVGGVSYLLFSGSSSSSSTKPSVLDTALKDLTPEEIRQLGLEGDTKNDTVRTLIGAAKESNRRYEKVISQNEKILKENETLRKREQDVQQQVDEAVQSKTRELQNMVAILREEMSQLVQGRTSSNESSTYQGNTTNGIGVEEDTPLPIGNGQVGTGTEENGQRVEWVNPDDQIEDERNPAKIGFPNLNAFNTTSGKKGLPFISGSDENDRGTTSSSSSSGKQKNKIAV